MDISKYTVSGYARFYRSLLRFRRMMSVAEALKLTYRLYAAAIESQRLKAFGGFLKEVSEAEFCERITRADARPYRTEIQLYRAMESLLCKIDVSKVKIICVKAVMEMIFIMEDIELSFCGAFDMEIDDGRTVYNLCAKSLVPRADEPGLCLLKDWSDAVSAPA
jgi:hypothetical protein